MVNGLAVLALVQAVTLGGRVQGGITVAPDTVRVGDPFVVTVRVRAPLGASIQFPAGPDSGRAVEPLDPVQVVTTGDSIAVDQTARYRLAAWRVGRFPITFDDVVVRQDIGTRRIEISNVTITVASVLPPDSANLDPRPQRAVFTFGLPWWVYVLAGLVAAAILTLVWWLWRRRRQVARVREPAIAIAEREFDRVDAIGLVAAGERARYVALMTEVLRDYLAAAVPEASISQTTNELAGAMRRAGIGTYARAAALLAEVDLVKFARRPLTAERATALGREIRSIATAVHQAVSGTDQTAQAA